MAALAHLKAFRATFNDDDEVDEESGLTARDLDEAIAAMGGGKHIENEPEIVWREYKPEVGAVKRVRLEDMKPE